MDSNIFCFLKEKLPPKSVKQLKQLELGLAALRCLQSAWSDRLAHLVENPELIVESLIMAQQTVAIRKLLKASVYGMYLLVLSSESDFILMILLLSWV